MNILTTNSISCFRVDASEYSAALRYPNYMMKPKYESAYLIRESEGISTMEEQTNKLQCTMDNEPIEKIKRKPNPDIKATDNTQMVWK